VKAQAHKLYEKTRTVEAKMRIAGRTEYTPQEWEMVQEANQAMAKLFGDAWSTALHGAPVGLSKAVKGRTKHYDWNGDHVEWTPGRVPMRVKDDGHRVPIYDMERFFRNAREALRKGTLRLVMLSKALAAKGVAPGQPSMFGGAKAQVKQHTRKTKSGKVAMVTQHQRARKPAQAKPSKGKASPVQRRLLLDAWNSHANHTASWATLLDQYVGDASVAASYADQGSRVGMNALIEERVAVGSWLSRYARNREDAVKMLTWRDDIPARTTKELNALAKRKGMKPKAPPADLSFEHRRHPSGSIELKFTGYVGPRVQVTGRANEYHPQFQTVDQWAKDAIQSVHRTEGGADLTARMMDQVADALVDKMRSMRGAR
jgi:hypothetical protein